MSNRWFVIWLVLLGGLFSACCRREGEPPPPPRPPPAPEISALLSEAKQSLAEKDYSHAIQLCLRAEEIDAASAEAKYCVLLSVETWRRFVALGKALRDNIEVGSNPVALRGALQALADDLRAVDPNLRLTQRPAPDVVALDFGAFVKAPPYLSDLLPYYFTFSTAATTTVRFDLAVELESYEAETGESFVQKGGYEAYRGAVGDFEHFRYATPDAFAAGVTVVAYTFRQMSVPLEVAADGVSADEKSPALLYIALQDPSFGQWLAMDSTGQGAFASPDNAAFNKALANLVKYYCLDLTKEMPEAFHESAYAPGNQIGDCMNNFEHE